MLARFTNVITTGTDSNIRKFIETTNDEELFKVVSAKVCNSDDINILDKVLTSFHESDSEALQIKRRKLVESILKELQKTKVTTNHVDTIVNRIIVDFSKYSKQQLTKLVDFCLISIRENNDENKSWKDILPSLLEILEEEKYVNHMGAEVSGNEYKSLIIKSICNSHWNLDILTSLAKMFRDISLEKADHDTVFKGLCSQFSDIPLNEIPPLVYQLLRLCKNPNERILLETLKTFFESKYLEATKLENKESIEDIGNISFKEVQVTESTVMYHIHHAAKVNHKVLRNYMSFLKNVSTAPEYILNPFIMGVLLLVFEIYEDQIFDIIRIAIIRKLQEEEKSKSSIWLKEILPQKCSLIDTFDQIIRDSVKDRHLILKSLVNLAFLLMSSEQKTKDESKDLWEIGTNILRNIMKKRHDSGLTVLQLLTEKIVSSGSHVEQYTDYLAYMCLKLTIIVLDCQVWIISLLDQLLSIPGDAAIKVLYAVLPLIRISANIRENLILTLRKALYRKDTVLRQMAITGFIEMLKNIKINTVSTINSTQSSNSSGYFLTQVTLERDVPQLSGNSKIHLYHDVLNILKKCFSYEYETKLHLYNGLYDAILNNPQTSIHILDMLYMHFSTYYESDENIQLPIRLDTCMDTKGVQVVLTEPIAELIFTLQKIYIKTASNDEAILDKLSIILESLCKRMAQLELEHINLDESTDLTDNLPKTQQKLQSIILLLMIYDTLITYRITTWANNDNNIAQTVYSLFKAKNRLADFLKRNINPKKAGRKKKKDDTNNTTINQDLNNTTFKKPHRPASIKIPNSLIDLETILRALSIFYSDSVPWANQEQLEYLKGRYDFHQYIFQGFIQHLQNLKSLTSQDLRRHKNKYMQMYFDIGELLYKCALPDLENLCHIDPQTAALVVESFKELCDLMCTNFFSEISKFLVKACNVDGNLKVAEQIFTLVSFLRYILKEFLQQEQNEDLHLKRIPLILIETIRNLTYKIDFNEIKNEKILDYMKKFSYMDIDDSSVAITILQLLLWVEDRVMEFSEILNDICIELCFKIGPIDKVEISIEEKYKILQEERYKQAYNALNSHLKEKLGNASWLLSRIKAEQTINTIPGLNKEALKEELKKKERSLCRQLSHIIQMLHTLTNTKVEPGPSTDFMFKNLYSLYFLLGNLTKYFHSTSTTQHPAFQAVKFVQVVQLAGKPLKSAFYNFITHTDESQNRNITKTKSDTHAQRNKILKETKTIPRVVYAIEVFSKCILLLSKKTGVPLESYIKHSVTRDFRINNTELAEALEKMNVSALNTQEMEINDDESTEDTTNDENKSEEEIDTPSRKRSKRSLN